MADGVSITFDITLMPEATQAIIAAGSQMLQGTAKFPGFQSVRIVRHRDDPDRLLFIERWESEGAYERYVAWREEAGAMDSLRRVAVRTETNVWPRVVAQATSVEPIAETEGVSITFALTLKPEMVGPFTSVGELGPVTGFPGFRSIRLVQHGSDPTRVLFIERWESEAAYKAYVDWQEGQGGMERIRQVVTRMQTDVWPTLVANA